MPDVGLGPPIRSLGRREKCRASGLNEAPVTIAQGSVAQVVLTGEVELYVADGEPGTLHVGRYAFVAYPTDPNRPSRRERLAHFSAPRLARARQKLRPQKRASRRLAPVHHGDVG